MKLKEVLSLIDKLHIHSGTSEVYLCGGIPRDKILGLIGNKITDIDLTTGDKTIKNLAKEVSIELSKKYQIVSKTAADGHTSLYVGDLKLDFSSNFLVPNIDNILLQKGIKNPTDLQKETYSRDFTCNSLLMTIDLKKIKDITGEGFRDIKGKIIRTCLDPDITFKHNTNRIIRVIYLSAKLGFDVDEKIIKWIKENPEYIRKSESSYLSKNIDKALSYNPETVVKLLNETNMWDYIPITENLQPYYQKSVGTKLGQLFRNYDYAEDTSGPGRGFYADMQKYKSISDFRKKKIKKRKKIIKKLKDMKLK